MKRFCQTGGMSQSFPLLCHEITNCTYCYFSDTGFQPVGCRRSHQDKHHTRGRVFPFEYIADSWLSVREHPQHHLYPDHCHGVLNDIERNYGDVRSLL